MKIHNLKILPKYFEAQILGIKQFEVRKNDRDFEVGDILLLQEYVNNCYTGNLAAVKITFILDDFVGLKENYVVLGTERLQ